jgi:hypothetical protein
MQGKRLAAEPLRRMVHEAAAWGNVRAVGRQPHSAAQTFSRGRRPLGGLDVSEAQRWRACQREPAAWPRRVGARTLEKRRLQEGLGKHGSAGQLSAQGPRSGSRRNPSARDTPAGAGRCPAVPSIGRPAHGTRRHGDSACLRARRGTRAGALATSPLGARLPSRGASTRRGAVSGSPQGCQAFRQSGNDARWGRARPPRPGRRRGRMSGALSASMTRPERGGGRAAPSSRLCRAKRSSAGSGPKRVSSQNVRVGTKTSPARSPTGSAPE